MKRTHKRSLRTHDTFTETEKMRLNFISPKKQKLIRSDILTSKKLIQSYMQNNDIDGIILCVDLLKMVKRLDIFMKLTNHLLFDWALKNENVTLLNHLISNIQPENQLLMTSHDNYAPIKTFITNTLTMELSAYKEQANHKLTILNQIIVIDPELSKIISDEMASYKAVFKHTKNPQKISENDLNKIIDSLQKNLQPQKKIIPSSTLGKNNNTNNSQAKAMKRVCFQF